MKKINVILLTLISIIAIAIGNQEQKDLSPVLAQNIETLSQTEWLTDYAVKDKNTKTIGTYADTKGRVYIEIEVKVDCYGVGKIECYETRYREKIYI